MRRCFFWVGCGLALAMVLLLLAAFALGQWTGSDGFRQRVEREATAALGVPVTLSRVTVDVFPLPALALEGLNIQARPALTLQRVEARPVWWTLLQGRLAVATLIVRQAVLPQTTIVLLAARVQDPAGKPAAPAPDGEAADLSWLPRRVVLDDVTWIGAQGRSSTVQAELALDDDGWPADATVAVTLGALQGTQAVLRREDERQTAWTLKVDVGGGTVQGPLKVTRPEASAKARDLVFEGTLETQGVEVSALTAPSRTLTGRLDASTTLAARINPKTGGASLADAMRTQTRFTVNNAVLHGVDLAKAVATVGLSRGGSTELDTLAGQVRTRGQLVELTNLVASSGVLAATGEVTVAPSKALSGRVRVDVTRGAGGDVVGVPLVVGGTVDDPSVSLSRSALLGAAIGTALMPGVGTGAGANLGDRVGEGLKDLFGK
ncbi:hypothetical protein [Hydrogenophaga sp. PBL-H3]|uniref:hypothetical protein n=1 Tax=Hydrogenophaga sp. PBL-H3 TaxID=434010 RepID=UPI0013203B35|nr:hypothetical protein [Hydrogenophaga sp. PBL-H3]QHE74627.1 hypothetical protein F9Z45_00495 [Hydrogenophaga sp. PBL-H3]QHE79052.1 hypothetical protein F9Z44_00495 [Hydrogenophaga sp. PBL-H3]